MLDGWQVPPIRYIGQRWITCLHVLVPSLHASSTILVELVDVRLLNTYNLRTKLRRTWWCKCRIHWIQLVVGFASTCEVKRTGASTVETAPALFVLRNAVLRRNDIAPTCEGTRDRTVWLGLGHVVDNARMRMSYRHEQTVSHEAIRKGSDRV